MLNEAFRETAMPLFEAGVVDVLWAAGLGGLALLYGLGSDGWGPRRVLVTGLAVLWSSVSHWVLGVPYDSIMRARRGKPPEAMRDLHDLTRVNVNRILFIATSGKTIVQIDFAQNRK